MWDIVNLTPVGFVAVWAGILVRCPRAGIEYREGHSPTAVRTLAPPARRRRRMRPSGDCDRIRNDRKPVRQMRRTMSEVYDSPSRTTTADTGPTADPATAATHRERGSARALGNPRTIEDLKGHAPSAAGCSGGHGPVSPETGTAPPPSATYAARQTRSITAQQRSPRSSPPHEGAFEPLGRA
jgi:hypothetical protein